jgi:hypothetical protein
VVIFARGVTPLPCPQGAAGVLAGDSEVMKAMIPILLAATLGLVACKSEEEKAREQALEQRADKLEEQAKATTDAANTAAKNVKQAGEEKSDALKEAADKTREQK